MSGPSKATLLVGMALEQFRLGCSSDGAPFAVALDGPNVALSLRGRGGLRSAMASTYYLETGEAPGQGALSEATAVLEGMAMASTREPVMLRVGSFGNGLVMDLGRADGRVIFIFPGGWEVQNRSPVLFRSTESVGELPIPTSGGHLAHLAHLAHLGQLGHLRTLLNLLDEDWPTLVAFMVGALMPHLAHPVAFFTGEQGTAKSSASRLVVRTFDGSTTDVQSAPRSEDDWAVVASSSWTVAIDNISKIDPWLSDAICRASTGAMWRKRTLYTDDNVSILRIKRVVVLNGIDPEVTRGDLAERLIRFDLVPITSRRSDEEIEEAFSEMHPGVLGALCDLTAKVLEVLPDIEVEDPPRMMSFAKVVAAVDSVLGTEGLKRYRYMVQAQVAQAAEGDIFAQTLDRFMASTGGIWQGSASELLSALGKLEARGRDDLPKTPQAVGSALSRVATSLRVKGWDITRAHSGTRSWTIRDPQAKGRGDVQGVQGVQGGGGLDGLDMMDTFRGPIPPEDEGSRDLTDDELDRLLET